jgi:hypothetical protein
MIMRVEPILAMHAGDVAGVRMGQEKPRRTEVNRDL